MRILYVAMKHDYGRPEQGPSYEHWNFYDTLARLGHRILYFDFMEILARIGRESMNRRLLEVARAERPDLVFSVLFQDELEPRVVRSLADDAGAPTLNWFCDDAWRFDDFSRRWAPHFTRVVTTSETALERYRRAGIRNVLKSQWACNHFLYRRLELEPVYDLTFVGQPHGNRRAVIQALRDAGLDVRVWGRGWESGRLTQEEMIRVFNASRINLNLANTSSPPLRRSDRIRARARRAASAVLARLPGGAGLKRLGRRMLAGGPAGPEVAGLVSQMKGRNFEVPGCGGFLLTDPAEAIERYYEPGREVALFGSLSGLIERARHYLAHEEERRAVARAGWERTLREHTYAHRFAAIFSALGLPSPSPEEVLARPPGRGETEEIAP
jgi:spore maturation protein CgeB